MISIVLLVTFSRSPVFRRWQKIAFIPLSTLSCCESESVIKIHLFFSSSVYVFFYGNAIYNSVSSGNVHKKNKWMEFILKYPFQVEPGHMHILSKISVFVWAFLVFLFAHWRRQRCRRRQLTRAIAITNSNSTGQDNNHN